MSSQEFSKWRILLWPIRREELGRVVPMGLMMFFFLFNYTIMRDTKDTLVLTAAGAEAIPFIKFYGTLPISILFVLTYAKMSNLLKPKTLYIATVLPFLIFFVGFGFVLYPLREFFQPTKSAALLQSWGQLHLPDSMQETFTAICAIYKHWMYSLFYVFAELWGSMGVSLLFWQFANQITSTDEARRFYPRFTQIGNLSLIASGYAIIYFSNMRFRLPPEVDAWGVTLKWLMGLIGVSCVLLLILYQWLYRKTEGSAKSETKKERPKLSLKESFRILSRSPYLGLITILIVAYGLSINLIEIVYKSHLKMQFPEEGALSAFVGKLSMSIGLVTLILVTCSSFILSRISWRAAALTTPLVILATGGAFFFVVMHPEWSSSVFHAAPLWVAVLIGTGQNALAKGMKYTLFDPSKEMAYIPLDPDSKVKGKAAIEVVGGRLGKSLGGLTLQFVLLFGSVVQNLPILFSLILLVGTIWVVAIFALNKRYKAAVEKKRATAAALG